METSSRYKRQDTATEMRAIVDLVDANVSPVADAETWDREIAARRRGGPSEPPAANPAIREVIDLSTALA